jgi:lipopolysaccharide transport system ATP-binding protein
MTVRLAFAVAAHLEPEILIIDEVLAVGDVSFQKKCLGKMKDVSSHGRTVLFVSHNMASIESLCTKGLVIGSGSTQFEGNTKSAIDIYLNENMKYADIPLIKREDRQGVGGVKVSNITLTDEKSTDKSVLNLGEKLCIKLKLTSKYENVKLRFIIGIYDHMNTGILRFDTDLTGSTIVVDKTESIVTCETDEIPITPGNYFANIAILNGDFMEDYITHAFSLNIIPSDYFGTGKLFKESESNLYKCLVKHRWVAE